jgi:8-oxo-dGTP diphosphatase
VQIAFGAAVKAGIRIVAAVIERDGRYLITQRRSSAVLPLLWEFPGGRVEHGESDVVALQREVRHRVGAQVTCGRLISAVTHAYDSYSVDLYLYECTMLPGEIPDARAVNDFKWVASSDFDRYPFTPADEASMTKLLGLS